MEERLWMVRKTYLRPWLDVVAEIKSVTGNFSSAKLEKWISLEILEKVHEENEKFDLNHTLYDG